MTRLRATSASPAEEALFLAMRSINMPMPVREFRFHLERRWRLDFAWPDIMVGAEVDGGRYKYAGGRHSSSADYEKRNALTILGWRTFYFLASDVLANPLQQAEFLHQQVLHSYKSDGNQ